MADRRFEVVLAASAKTVLGSLTRGLQVRIVQSLRGLETDPRPRGAALLRGSPGERLWRIRVGDYRVLYEIQDRELVVLVIRLGHRRDVYRR